MTDRPAYLRGTSAAEWDAARTDLEQAAADRDRPYDGRLSGALDTVRWLHGEPIHFDGRLILPFPPVSVEDYYGPSPETIQEEYGAALLELAHGRHERDDYLHGVVDVLRWAWLGTGEAPALSRLRRAS